MQILLHPTYFPTIAYISALKKHDVVFEVCDFYEKQTYRNRMYLYGANGKQMLVVPIVHLHNSKKQSLKDVKIDNTVNWRSRHRKTLETAYRTSAYFEYYEAKLEPLFSKTYTFLIDLNFESLDFICSCIKIDLSEKIRTEEYLAPLPDTVLDMRKLSDAKTGCPLNFESYYQLFSEKQGFLENLSALDLIFNVGPNAEIYLEKNRIPEIF